jgi:hypothetical protein
LEIGVLKEGLGDITPWHGSQDLREKRPRKGVFERFEGDIDFTIHEFLRFELLAFAEHGGDPILVWLLI